jgi:multicomponent Na+:H+ antiporter subunit D
LSVLAHPTSLADWVVVLPVLLALVGAALLVMLRAFLRWQPWIAAIVLLAILVVDGLLLQRVLATGPLSMTMGNWLPPFGISFTADAMGAGFATAAAFVGFAVVLYLMGDAPETAIREGLYPLVLLLLAGVSGAFLTGDLFNLYVWFEVLLIASFGLIVLAGNPLQLDGAVKYGVLNVIATALFLAGLGLLYGLLGTLNMADIIGAARHAELAPLTAIAALFALAFAMKAAAFPVNAWLPASYHTPPAAISALLGGLLTKVGVYAFLRLFVMLLPTTRIVLAPTIEAIAIATLLLGPLSAIAETNPRRAVGFLLIGGIGIALLAVPGAQSAAVLGAIAYVLASMLTLAALYLAVGAAEKASSSLLSGMVFVLILATAGIPPFLGFWPKLLLLQGLIAGSDWVAVFALLLGSLLTLIAGLRLWSRLFRQHPAAGVDPMRSIAPIVLLSGTVLLLGLWPSLMLDVASAAARDLLDPARYIAAVGLSP